MRPGSEAETAFDEIRVIPCVHRHSVNDGILFGIQHGNELRKRRSPRRYLLAVVDAMVGIPRIFTPSRRPTTLCFNSATERSCTPTNRPSRWSIRHTSCGVVFSDSFQEVLLDSGSTCLAPPRCQRPGGRSSMKTTGNDHTHAAAGGIYCRIGISAWIDCGRRGIGNHHYRNGSACIDHVILFKEAGVVT